MTEKIMNIKSISQFHETINFEPPKHPLISVIDVSKMQFPSALIGTKISTSFYTISLKDASCGMLYGRNQYDFEEGTLIFTAPNQVVSASQESVDKSNINNTGWIMV